MLTFLCDEMLTGLGRWLRIAGYDTLIVAAGSDDKLVIEMACSSQRIFLTCDAVLYQRLHNKATAICFKTNITNECIYELNKKLDLNWIANSFSRCSVCNLPLITATQQQIKSLELRLYNSRNVLYCSHCNKFYWEGSHVNRMKGKLQEFQSLGRKLSRQ